jgi:DNA-binding SARP family transcriptional activator
VVISGKAEKAVKKSTPVLKVKMLGGFSLIYGQTSVVSEERKRKVWTLLEFLLINRRREISHDDLVDLLCHDDKSASPGNVVKNVVYRLRSILEECGLPSRQCILCKKSVYAWNPALPCEIDVEIFEDSWKMAEQTQMSDSERLTLYLSALDLYQGHFLPRATFEEWSVPYQTYYHRIFSECVFKTYELLSKTEDYEKILSVCVKATTIDPFDESFYEMLITALIKLGRQKEALVAYETVTSRLYNELGINPSKSLLALYRDIMKTIKSVERDLIIIKEDLREVSQRDGAYFCEYEIFKDMYRFSARSLERTGQSVFVMLVTLTNMNDEIPSAEYIGEYMEKVYEIVASQLRRGDLFARFSSTQYVCLLPGTSYENGCRVGERISTSFNKINRRRSSIKLHFKLQPLEA